MESEIEEMRLIVEKNHEMQREAEREKREHEKKVAETAAALKSNALNQGGGKKFTTDQTGSVLFIKAVNTKKFP